MSKLNRDKVLSFLVQHESKKKSSGFEEKKTMVYINGQATYLDTASVKDTLRDMSVENINSVVEKEIHNSIEDFRNTNISVIRNESYFIINGSIQTRESILSKGIELFGVYYNLLNLSSLTINKKFMDTEEIIKYFGNSEKVNINHKFTKLEKALMGAVNQDSPYAKQRYVDRNIKPLPTNNCIYTLSLGIEDILGIIDTLMENFMTVDYTNLCFIRNSRYPISIDQLTDDNAILNKIKFPFLCVEWVCVNLKKTFIKNGGYSKLYSYNDLINGGVDLSENTFQDMTLEESLVHYLFNFDTFLIRENGYSYIDIPTLYFDGEKNVSEKCRFVYLHGLIKVETITGERKLRNTSKSNIYNGVLKDATMYSIVTTEAELYSSVTRLMENDIIFNSIIELYNKALTIFMDKTHMFIDHVIEFDTDNPDLKLNVRDHIFKFRYNEARDVLILNDVSEDFEDTEKINDFILNEDSCKKVNNGIAKIICKDKEETAIKENAMKARGKRNVIGRIRG